MLSLSQLEKKMKKILEKLNFTFNEGVMLLVIVLFVFLKLLFQTPIWIADYQFWKVDGYSKQGTMPINQSSLVLPEGQGGYYCMDMKRLSGEPAFTDTMSIGGVHKPFHCGCLGLEDNAVVKYKLLKDKIVYQCLSEILTTQHIPASMEKQ